MGLIDRVIFWITNWIQSQQIGVVILIDEEVIYDSLVGTKKLIEKEEIVRSLIQLEKEEIALKKGKIYVLSLSGGQFERVPKSESEVQGTKVTLRQRRKELEARMQEWRVKWETQ
jgi:hypothetical protein